MRTAWTILTLAWARSARIGSMVRCIKAVVIASRKADMRDSAHNYCVAAPHYKPAGYASNCNKFAVADNTDRKCLKLCLHV